MSPKRLLKISWWKHSWMAVSLLSMAFAVGFLMQRNFNETQRINDRVDTRVEIQILQSRIVDKKIDQLRNPLCAVMYSSLSRPPLQPVTPQALQSRRIFYKAYGPEGLNCTTGPLPRLEGIPDDVPNSVPSSKATPG